MKSKLLGQTYGALKVVRIDRAMAMCLCTCGAKVTVWASNLATGNTKSCGCLRNTAGGLSKKAPEYNVWAGMLKRCHNPADQAFANYGARGIKVCERWRESFPAFLSDMGHRPSNAHTIERINNDGDYEPTNCRWAPRAEQARNMRKTHYLTFHGRKQYLGGWAKELGLPYHTLRQRISLLGWSVKRALTTPQQGRSYDRGVKLTYEGRTLNISEWAKKIGKSGFAIANRLKAGASVEVALSRKRFSRWHQIPRK